MTDNHASQSTGRIALHIYLFHMVLLFTVIIPNDIDPLVAAASFVALSILLTLSLSLIIQSPFEVALKRSSPLTLGFWIILATKLLLSTSPSFVIVTLAISVALVLLISQLRRTSDETQLYAFCIAIIVVLLTPLALSTAYLIATTLLE